MANVDLIRDALQKVEEQSLQLTTLLQALDAAGGESPPPWLFAFHARVDPLDGAIQDLICNLNLHVMPILADMSLNRGMGGVPPMVTKVMAGQSAPSRP